MEKKTWDEFSQAGLLWFVNRLLHLFGWAICIEENEEGEVVASYPARVSFRGFTREQEGLGYERLTHFMAREGGSLLSVFADKFSESPESIEVAAEWTRDERITLDLLGLVDMEVAKGPWDHWLRALYALTDEELQALDEWASSVHAHASDNPNTKVLEQPACFTKMKVEVLTEISSSSNEEPVPSIIAKQPLSMHVCVPAAWSSKEIKGFADSENPCGTSGGWRLCESGDPILQGDSGRMPCDDHPAFVHARLEA